MRISLLTDELSADPETAVELGTEWGIRDFEIRGFYADRVPLLSSYQKRRLHDVLADYQANVVGISPGLFKMPLPPREAARSSLAWMDRASYADWESAQQQVEYHLNELLPASLDFANEFGAKLVVIFSFGRGGAEPGEAPDQVLDILLRAAERANAAGLQLALENEDGFWGDTGERSAKILRTINHPALGLNWDPGNAFFAGDTPFPTGYEFVRGLIRHVHFKDASRDASGVPYYTVRGEIDWAGQICALARDSYDGCISIETHERPKVAKARASLEYLRELLAAAERAAAS